MSATVSSIVKNSIADELGIAAGDIVHSVNGCVIKDILDYKFLTADESFELEIHKKNGEIEVIDLFNEEYEDLGIVFENPLIDTPKKCANKCIFCFVDQLPQGMRDTLYFKDDDYRLSALQGNYITLTNLTDSDISRIIELRLPRINISVHTTDGELRKKMLNNKNADRILHFMERLKAAEVAMNAQIVLCKGVNDGTKLDETLEKLAIFAPQLQSVSVVPYGKTKFRKCLHYMESYDIIDAKNIIGQVEYWQARFLRDFGSRLVFLADEFYIQAGMPLPPTSDYENFLQIENGVGMTRCLIDEFEQELESSAIPESVATKTLVTGVLAADTINSLVARLPFENINVRAIKNNFFGESVTVAGLVTGQDIIAQLQGAEIGEYLVIPDNMLRRGEDVFLDDVTTRDLEKALGAKVLVAESGGKGLWDAILK